MKSVFHTTRQSTWNANGTYYAVLGTGPFGDGTTEATMKTRFRTAGEMTNLLVRVSSNSVTAASTLRTRINDGNGNLAISITASTTGDFSDNVNSDTVAAGDYLDYQFVLGATGTSMQIGTVRVVFETGSVSTTLSKWVVARGDSTAIDIVTASTTRFFLIDGLQDFDVDTESLVEYDINTAGIWKNLFLNVTANARTSATSFATRINGADGNVTVSVPATTTGVFENTSDTDSVAANDNINLSYTSGEGADTLSFVPIATEFITANKNFGLHNGVGTGTVVNALLTRYFPIGGGSSVSTVNTRFRAITGIKFRISNLVCNIGANTIDAGTSTVTLSRSAISTSVAVSIGFGETGLFEDASDSVDFSVTEDTRITVITSGSSGNLSFRILGVNLEFLQNATFNVSGIISQGISTWAELAAIADNDDGAFHLLNDLDENTADYDTYAGPSANGGAGWTPISAFYGILDGRGYSIKDLFIELADSTGIFAACDTASIHDLNIVDANITGTVEDYHGVLSGYVDSTTIYNVIITGLIVNASAVDYVGGLAGYAVDSWIYDCRVEGSIYGDTDVGGFVGSMGTDCEVYDCYVNVTVNGIGLYVGGFTGEITSSCVLYRCVAFGDVYGDDYVGGFIGRCFGGISDSYARGNVTETEEYRDGNQIGGFAGQIDNTSGVTDCYSSGLIDAGNLETNVGGFCGLAEDVGDVTNCFWDINTSGIATSSGGTGKTTGQMQDILTFSGAGWDIIGEMSGNYVWGIL